MAEYLYGRNVVRECLRAQRRHIHKLQLAGDSASASPFVQEVVRLAKALNIPIQKVSGQMLNKLGGKHQGMALEVGRLPKVTMQDLLDYAERLGQAPFFLALDHLEDPQNVGALLRTAEAVGVHGIIVPSRRSVGVTPAVAKASAGATEHLRIAVVPNLVQALNLLKKANIWVVGVEKVGRATPYHLSDLNIPLVLVLGSEGKGMTRLVQQTCDLLLKIPMQGQIASLNVSVAGALVLYEAWRVRQTSDMSAKNY